MNISLKNNKPYSYAESKDFKSDKTSRIDSTRMATRRTSKMKKSTNNLVDSELATKTINSNQNHIPKYNFWDKFGLTKLREGYNNNEHYLCSNCSCFLFFGKDTVDHNTKTRQICNWVFISKKEWISCCAIRNIFKIKCPNCEIIIGEGSLTGLLCNCGHWGAPAFRIHKDKIKFIPDDLIEEISEDQLYSRTDAKISLSPKIEEKY